MGNFDYKNKNKTNKKKREGNVLPSDAIQTFQLVRVFSEVILCEVGHNYFQFATYSFMN